jgi:septal ring factor EnvC (AmiA/AmiB activator)
MKDDDNKWWEKTDICAPAGKGDLKEMNYNRDWKDMYEKEHEALANALAGDHRQKEADELMMKKLERIQELEQINEDHHKLNGKLQMRITELEQDNLELHADNKKLALQVYDQVERARKAGM